MFCMMQEERSASLGYRSTLSRLEETLSKSEDQIREVQARNAIWLLCTYTHTETCLNWVDDLSLCALVFQELVVTKQMFEQSEEGRSASEFQLCVCMCVYGE